MIVKPAFKERNVPVVFSVDENYAPYLSVCICSLISNSSNTNNYDIWILDGGLTEVGKSQLKALANNRKNISIRFFDILNFKELKKKNFYISNHASLANYYRIFIPKIFFYYEKLIYLDCDLLINADIADLYAIDIGNNVLGVVKDACTYFDPDFWYKYCLEKVQIKKPYNYFNSGVLICNVKQMIDISLTERSMQRLKEFNPVCWDQCILNSVLENKVKYLPLNWNFQWHWLLPEFAQKHPFKFVEYNFLQ
ncbi:glycosyltransferase family 8 protein, partial [Parabacteroides johnsonii]|uniref:glycosyltransferase family 8 protein n=1 Tax=Parabacteroides johnsonii TaxID=387661 RepID=UPI00307FB3D2